MNFFQKKLSIKPKKLTLHEMWELYKSLSSSLGNKELLVDEIENIIDSLSPDTFLYSLKLLYKDYDSNKYISVEMLTHFIRGIKENKFFEFVEFIKAINGSSK